MAELGDELQRLADQAALSAQPLAPGEVMRHGERRRRRRMFRDAAAALAVALAGVITAGVLWGASSGQHPIRQLPETRPTSVPSPTPASPSPGHFSPSPSPSPTGG